MNGHLAEVAPLAPAIPAGLLALLGLVAFLGYLIATGTLKVYAATFGHLILWLADAIDVRIRIPRYTLHPLRPVASGLRGVDKAIRWSLAEIALAGEDGASWLFTQAGNIMAWTGREIGDLAEAVASALHLQRTVEIPKVMRAQVASALARVRAVNHDLDRLEAQAAAQWARLRHGIDRLDGLATRTLPHEIARLRAQVAALPRDIARLGGRVTHVERKLGAATFAGLVATALATLGLNWARCRNVSRVGKRACGMDPDLLESVLGGTLLLLSAISIEQLARELQEPTELVTDGLHKLIREF